MSAVKRTGAVCHVLGAAASHNPSRTLLASQRDDPVSSRYLRAAARLLPASASCSTSGGSSICPAVSSRPDAVVNGTIGGATIDGATIDGATIDGAATGSAAAAGP